MLRIPVDRNLGKDYMIANLQRVATLIEGFLVAERGATPLSELARKLQASIQTAIQVELQGVALPREGSKLPEAAAQAAPSLRPGIIPSLLRHDYPVGAHGPTVSTRRAPRRPPSL
jgi:hypothetical protein